MLTKADARNITLSYCYEPLNRLTSKAYTQQSCPMPSPVATYSYDQGPVAANPVGRRTGMTDPAGSSSWTYNPTGHPLTEQRTTNGITKTTTYTYNFDGSIAAPSSPVVLVDYFANANTLGAPDATVRIINPGTTDDPASNGTEAEDLCALIYVFDANQEMSECCGCYISANGLLTLSVNKSLTSNPSQGTKLHTGVIKVVSSTQTKVNIGCDPTVIGPMPSLRAWATHIQNKVGTAYPVTEGESQAAVLGAGEQADLAEDCKVLEELGSGAGVCSCPPGHN